MSFGRNYQFLLIVMILSIVAAYLIADYLPNNGINTYKVLGDPFTDEVVDWLNEHFPVPEPEPRERREREPLPPICCGSCRAGNTGNCVTDCPQCFPATCGAAGQICCVGNTCNPGFACQTNVCRATTSCQNGTVPAPKADEPCSGWTQIANLSGSSTHASAIQSHGDLLISSVSGLDNKIYVMEWNTSSSSLLKPWYPLNGSTNVTPKFFVNSSSNLLLYAQGLNGVIYYSTYLSPGSWTNFTNTNICNANFGASGPLTTKGSDGNVYNASGLGPIYLYKCSSLPPPGCTQSNPTVSVNPTFAILKLGQTVNFTANVTNMDNSACGNTQFVFNASQVSFTLFSFTFDMFNITTDSTNFNLAPGQSRLVNFSYQTDFALPSNYSLNATASDISNLPHAGTGFFTIKVLESLSALNFTCSPLSIGYRCMFNYISNYVDRINVLFLVSNSKSKIISSVSATSTLGDILTFDFYCSIFGPGTYKISWIAYRSLDTSLTNPIAYSTSSQDRTLNC